MTSRSDLQPPLISAVICTYNRVAMLEGAVQSLVEQTLDKQLYEIVVVDNGSSDATPALLKDIQTRHPQCRIVCIYEPAMGLGRARNTGTAHAEGQYVAFMDDDARANADWLEQALRCLREVQPQPIAVGGVIQPFYTAPRPAWFKDEYEGRTKGPQPGRLSPGDSFSGSNMVFLRQAIQTHGGFDVRVGVKGKHLSLGEEASLFWRIWAQAGDPPVFYYSPALVVYHEVPGYKMTVSYRLKRAFATGQALHVMEGHKSLATRARLALHLARHAAGHLVGQIGRFRQHEAYQNWVVEDLSPAVVDLGRLAACLGVFIHLKQA